MSRLDWNELNTGKEKTETPKMSAPTAEGKTDTTGSIGGITGLETIEMGAARIRVDDKKIINCHADLNQLVPFKYNWA